MPLARLVPASLEAPVAADPLREALRRCSPITLAAAHAYRESGDAAHLPLLIRGVIERYVEPDLRPRLQDAAPQVRLVEDLGMDSLTILEIVLLTEEVLNISISAEELRSLRTLADLQQFLVHKAQGLPVLDPRLQAAS